MFFNNERVAQKAIELIGGKIVKSEKLPIVFDPSVGADFMEVISGILSAESVQKGKSALAGKIGKQTASSIITIIDDATLQNALATAPFDEEGTPSQKNILIENGILKGYLYNLYSASKDKTRSTGNAQRGSFKNLPGIGSTNFYLAPGKRSSDEIISNVTKGIYITRVMAMHSVNPISGDFSVGAAGVMIENGKKTFPVRGITIAGNLLELLSSIADVGNDLRFFVYSGNCGSPTLLVDSLMVGGE